MATDIIQKALHNIENLALAYTVKTSSASTPEQFLNDYAQNLELFEKEKSKHPTKWQY